MNGVLDPLKQCGQLSWRELLLLSQVNRSFRSHLSEQVWTKLFQAFNHIDRSPDFAHVAVPQHDKAAIHAAISPSYSITTMTVDFTLPFPWYFPSYPILLVYKGTPIVHFKEEQERAVISNRATGVRCMRRFLYPYVKTQYIIFCEKTRNPKSILIRMQQVVPSSDEVTISQDVIRIREVELKCANFDTPTSIDGFDCSDQFGNVVYSVITDNHIRVFSDSFTLLFSIPISQTICQHRLFWEQVNGDKCYIFQYHVNGLVTFQVFNVDQERSDNDGLHNIYEDEVILEGPSPILSSIDAELCISSRTNDRYFIFDKAAGILHMALILIDEAVGSDDTVYLAWTIFWTRVNVGVAYPNLDVFGMVLVADDHDLRKWHKSLGYDDEFELSRKWICERYTTKFVYDSVSFVIASKSPDTGRTRCDLWTVGVPNRFLRHNRELNILKC